MNPLNNGNFNSTGLPDNVLQSIKSVKNLMTQFNAATNPSVLIQQMAQNNPAINQLLSNCQGKDMKQIFYSMCQQRGIDPNAVLKQLQS